MAIDFFRNPISKQKIKNGENNADYYEENLVENPEIQEVINEISLNYCDRLGTNLDHIQQIIQELQITPTYPIILIGGTNGKGSVCAYLTTILTNAGYNVGSFTSPHVFKYNERICINNTPINDTILLHTLKELKKYKLGIFQTLTLAMQQIFIANNIDIAIIEVGIGGANDITNLFEPQISAITSIDFDHQNILGGTLEQIGLEKAGIFRPNKCGFYGALNPPATVLSYANKIGTKLYQFNLDFGVKHNEFSFDVWCNNQNNTRNNFYTLPYPQLRGAEQPNNIALALSILSKLDHQFPVSLSTIKTSLLQTKLYGRFQIIPGVPQIVLDVAHNVQAVSHLVKNMVKLPFAKHRYAIFSIAKDKDAINLIKVCNTQFDKWFIASLASERSLSTENIAKILLDSGVKESNIIIQDTLTKALTTALHTAAINNSTKDSTRIVAFGSFLVVEECYRALKNIHKI